MEVTTIPSFMSERFDARGLYRVVARRPRKVARIWEAHCDCRVPLVGGRIEQHIVDEVKDSYRRTTAFTRRWLADHPPSA
jgi:hypothetical protein